MKRIFYSLICITVLCSCIHSPFKNDLNIYDLKGGVKTLSQTAYLAKNEFGTIVKGRPVYNQTYDIKFNTKGNITKSIEYLELSAHNVEKVRIEYLYTKNRLITKHIYNEQDKAIYFGKVDYYYDSKGKEIKNCCYEDSVEQYEIILRYKGNDIVEIKHYDINKELKYTQDNEFDRHHQLVEVTKHNNHDSIYCIKKYCYGVNHLLEKEEKYSANEEYLSYVSYKYNEHEDLVQKCCYNQLNELEYMYTMEYIYDTYGNWLEKVQYKNHELYSIVDRAIKYYSKE